MNIFAFALGLFTFTGGTNNYCETLNANSIIASVRDVLESDDRRGRNLEFSNLRRLWRKSCLSEREDATPNVVIELAKLLRVPVARMQTAAMLADVGINLRIARPALEAALEDQIKIEERERRESGPIAPPTDGVSSLSLQCVINKINGADISDPSCRFIEIFNSDV